MEIFGKGLDDVCIVCGGDEIDRGDGTHVCLGCGTVYRDDEYAEIFSAYNAMPEYVRIELCRLKTELRGIVYSDAPDHDKINALCADISKILTNDRTVNFYAATCADDKTLAAYYDAFDPSGTPYLVSALLLYAADKKRAVRPACKLIKRARSKGVHIDPDIEQRLLAEAEKLTAGYRMKASAEKLGSNIESAGRKAGDGIATAARSVGDGIKSFFTAIGHGLKTAFTVAGSAVKRFFVALGQGVKKSPRAILEFLKRSYRNEPPTHKVCLGLGAGAFAIAVLNWCLGTFLPVTDAAITACTVIHIITIMIEAIAASYVFVCIVKDIKARECFSIAIFLLVIGAINIPFMFLANKQTATYIMYGIILVGTAVWSVVYYNMCRKRHDVARSTIYLSMSFVFLAVPFII